MPERPTFTAWDHYERQMEISEMGKYIDSLEEGIRLAIKILKPNLYIAHPGRVRIALDVLSNLIPEESGENQ